LWTLLLLSENQLPELNGIVVLLVASGIDKRDLTLPCEGAQLLKKIGVLANLLCVTAAKFLPTGGIVAEPLAKLGAGRNVLHPLIDGGAFLRDPARPQPVD
jgi:hypothetical protein